jgi:heme-degrading monooxygenase HmoA
MQRSSIEGGAMFARLSVYEIPESRMDEAEDRFREALTEVAGMEGLEGCYFLVGTESNRAAALTLWTTPDSMARSRVTASRLRSEAARSLDGEVLSVEEFEVAVVRGAEAALRGVS